MDPATTDKKKLQFESSKMLSHDLGLKADATLAKECVAGNVQAWEFLFAEYHSYLERAASELLRLWNSDLSVAEDIVSKVWHALVDRDGELLSRYDSSRGVRLKFFLLAIVKDFVRRHIRSEKRRAERESVAREGRPWCESDEITLDSVMFGEFWDSLSDREQVFFNEHLISNVKNETGQDFQKESPEQEEGKISQSSIYSIRHRIRKKLLNFFR